MKTRKVYLEGEIGHKFGKEFDIAADSFSEVFRCLKCNFSNFMPYLQECHEKNIGFILEVEGKPIQNEAETFLLYKEGDMIITSVPAGSKSGGAKILAALALVAVVAATGGFGSSGYIAAGFAEGATTGAQIAAYAGLTAVSLATNLALTGIQQVMAPDPSVDTQQDESYIFQGTGQTLIEGDPVPVLYGELRIPGRTVSFHTRSERNQFFNFSRRATSSESNGNGHTSQNAGASGGNAGVPSPPTVGGNFLEYNIRAQDLQL